MFYDNDNAVLLLSHRQNLQIYDHLNHETTKLYKINLARGGDTYCRRISKLEIIVLLKLRLFINQKSFESKSEVRTRTKEFQRKYSRNFQIASLLTFNT